MKSVLTSACLVCLSLCSVIAQTLPEKKQQYVVTLETLSGEKKHGILVNVDSSRLELSLVKKGLFHNFRSQKFPPKSTRWILSPEQIKSFRISPKGSTNTAIGIGMLIGMTAGSVIGVVSTPPSKCPPNRNGCRAFEKLELTVNTAAGLFIGAGVGAFFGYIIGESRKKRFTVDGDQRRFLEIQETIADMIGPDQFSPAIR